MKEFPKLLAVLALSIGLAAPVLAADPEERREEMKEQKKDVLEEQRDVQQERRDVTEARKELRQDITQAHRASNVIGMNIKNPQGDTLGEIKDLVLDFDTGQIAYVAVSSGGVAGVGDTLHAVPWKALSLNDKMDAFVLNVDKGAWKNAPGIDQNDWPEVADTEFRQQLNTYYR
jgi:sporulation protein YlmC with PRC-barrel domain